jgi:hypothetical protein
MCNGQINFKSGTYNLFSRHFPIDAKIRTKKPLSYRKSEISFSTKTVKLKTIKRLKCN